jgi:phosphopantothenoylcysteine decarboxylase/phosphopantothenate--cysteine ligase
MHAAVTGRAAESDVIVMSAAVANYAPARTAPDKLPHDEPVLTIELVQTRDILADLAEWRRRRGTAGPLLVGFAAETGDVLARARAKRLRKGIDLIVANDVSREDAGFDVGTNAVTLIGDGLEETVPLASKASVASRILDSVGRLLESRRAAEGAPRQ